MKYTDKKEVVFDPKKGKSKVVTKGILQFSITGENFDIEKLAELLKSQNVEEI